MNAPTPTIAASINLIDGAVSVTWSAATPTNLHDALEAVLEGGRPEVAAVLHYLADCFDMTTKGRPDRIHALLAAAERAA